MPTTPRQSGLAFIADNPAMEAFQRGQQAAQQQQANQLAVEGQMVKNAEQVAGAPTRLRTINADADTARANADVAMRTVDPKVESARNASRLSRVNADVGEQTADARVRTSNAGAVSAEMQGFYKSLELLNAGQTEAAVEVARRYGQTIPPEVIASAELRNEITRAAKQAQTVYPNRQYDQQVYIQGFIKNLMERRAAGRPISDPAALYNVPGAPTPPEISTTAQTNRPSDVAMAEWLVAEKVAPDAATAWQMVRQSRSNPALIRSQIYRAALTLTFGNTQKAEEITSRAMKFIEQSTAAEAPGATGGEQPPGDGTEASPYQATTQAQVDWFKQNAPAGAVISINGQPYTK